MTDLLILFLCLMMVPLLYGINQAVIYLKQIRDELRLMRTGGVSFDPPRRGR